MTKKDMKKEYSVQSVVSAGCCRVESVISVDERGQTVLPKELRSKANIRAGDKLAVIAMEKEGKICCLSLIKAEELEGMVKNLLSPIMKDMYEKE